MQGMEGRVGNLLQKRLYDDCELFLGPLTPGQRLVLLTAKNGSGATPLMEAVQSQRAETVEWLLDRGVPVDEEERVWGPCHEAASTAQLGILELLLARGASIHAKVGNPRYEGLRDLVQICDTFSSRLLVEVYCPARFLLSDYTAEEQNPDLLCTCFGPFPAFPSSETPRNDTIENVGDSVWLFLEQNCRLFK